LKSALDCVVFQLDAGIKQARSDVFKICSGWPRALNPMLALDALRADSDEVAQAFRDEVARRSDMKPPGSGASLADDLCHSVLGRSIAGDVERTAYPV
jgi:hypothetical protein